MAVTTVAQLAAELNRSAAALLEQLQSAGVAKKSTDDALTESDKERLLDFLRTAHGTASGAERKKITLTRKSTSEIKQADSSGKARTIQVEVRKKRTFIKRDETAVSEEAPAPVVDEAELQRRQDEAQAQAELLRRQEAELAEKRRLREEQEKRDREAAEARRREEEAQAAAKAAEAASAAAGASAKAEPAAAAAPAAAAPAAPEVAKPALRVIKAADVVDEEKQRAADLAKRRKAAEDEAQAIRAMMNAPKRVLQAKKPEEAKPAEPGKEGIKGTIHKPAGAPGAAAPSAGAAKPGDKKSVKSEKLSSSWADDAAKKRAVKGRTDTPAGARPGWRAPRGGRRGDRHDGNSSTFVAPVEAQACRCVP